MSLKQFPTDPSQIRDADVENLKVSELLKKVDDYASQFHYRGKQILTEHQQLELMELIARFATVREINEYFVPTHKVTISPSLINQYKRTQKWKPVIKKFREKYLLSTDEIGGTHKKVRLDRADRIYENAYTKKDYRLALQANRDMHEMVEGKNNSGDLNMTINQYNVLDDEELKIRISEARQKLARTIDIPTKEMTNGSSR